MVTTKVSQEKGHDAHAPNRKKYARDLFIAIAVLICILLIVVFTPALDGPNRNRKSHEVIAVGHLRRIVTLQNNYAGSHPATGFACELPLLKSAEPDQYGYDPEAFLRSGGYLGYRISLAGCGPEPNGVVTRYRITAIPLEQGKSGIRAFCTDETGALWYDAGGSAEKCFASHRTLD
jgi:hypothetical protein